MLRRRGKIHHGLVVIANAVPSIGGFARALWSRNSGNRWMMPLVVFLCVTGLALIAAASVEAIAPFLYAIF